MATTNVDVYLTKARYVRSVGDVNVYPVLLPDDGPVGFYAPDTFLYPAELDGHSVSDGMFSFVPAGPSGGTLVSVKPFVVAHTEGDVLDITDDSSGWGYSPPPEWSPYLVLHHGFTPLQFDTFPADTDPGSPIVCGAGIPLPLDPDVNWFDDELSFTEWGTGSTTHIVVSAFGWRFTFETADAPGVPPLRLRQRADGKGMSSAPRLRGAVF